MPQIDFNYFELLWNKVIHKTTSKEIGGFSFSALNRELEKINFTLSEKDIKNINKKYLQFENESIKPEMVNLSNSIYDKLLKYVGLSKFEELEYLFKEKISAINEEYAQVGFIGRLKELQQLEEFIVSEKKLFGIFGVPMIGKSELVNHFITKSESLITASYNPPIIIRLNPQPEDAEQNLYDSIFGINSVHDFSIFESKTLIIIRNFEEVLEWSGNLNQLHSIKEKYKNLISFLNKLIKIKNIKLIIESRFQINFKEVISDHHKFVKTIDSQSKQLEGVDPEGFWKYYKFKGFKREDFDTICKLFNNHTALLSYAYNDVDWLYDNNLLNALSNPQATSKYLWKYVENTLHRLELEERLILCSLAILKEPINRTVLFQEVVTQIFNNVQILDYDDYLASLRKKLFVIFFNNYYDLNPYIREICYTSLQNNFRNEFNVVKTVDYIKENGFHPEYDKINQALEQSDYGHFYRLLKKERSKRNFRYVHSCLNKALSTKAKTVGVLNEIGITYKLEKKWPKAISVLEKAIKIENNNVRVLNELGICYSENQQIYKAIETLEKATKLGNLPSFTELAIIYREKNQIPEAIETLKNGLLIDNRNVMIMNELAITYSKNEQLNEAIKFCNKAISLDNFQSYSVLSSIYEKMGKIDEALDAIDAGVKSNGLDKVLKTQKQRLMKLKKSQQLKTISKMHKTISKQFGLTRKFLLEVIGMRSFKMN